MPLINRAWSGKLNLDAQPFRMPQGDYIDAINITRDSEGLSSDGVVSNIKGNELVDYTLPAGINKTIGSKEDKIRNRVYDFVWNSNGNHTIKYYDAVTDTEIKLIENLTDSGDVDILGFTSSGKIDSINILDGTDLVFYVDSLRRPSFFNVAEILAGNYGVLERSYIDVVKEPPATPPIVAYNDDAAITVNNLRKKLFKFKTRFVFENGEKSVWSAHSIMPIPNDYGDTNADADPTRNCYISIEVETGKINVKKIEIAVCVSLGNVYSDFLLIEVLDKEEDAIPDNSTTTFNFYNDKAYDYTNVLESIQPFDALDLANTQCMPNGNVLDYSGITEGYDNLASLGNDNIASASATPDTPIQPAYDWWSRFSFGLQYFDGKGRAVGGVQTNDALSVQSIAYDDTSGVQVPKINFEIWHEPPIDAEYFHWVRTKNLSKSRILQWISDRTFRDYNTEPDNYKYAFISIENLYTFIQNNPSTPLGYEFKPNDRIRFIKLFMTGGSTSTEIYTNKDYEIVGTVQNPTVNGVQHEGTFVKIVLPDIDADFNFGTNDLLFATDVNYFNYFIELYTPAQQVANGLDVYYEFGERYAILDAGTDDRRHAGQTQDQSVDLVTPALYSFDDGDYYYRERTINTGAELTYTEQSTESHDGDITLGWDFTDATYDDPNILTGNSPEGDLVGFDLATNDDRWLLKVLSGTYTFRAKGTISVNFIDFGEIYSYFFIDNLGNKTYLVRPQLVSGQNVFVFDVSFQLSASTNPRIFIMGDSAEPFNNHKQYNETIITITRELNYTQGIIDPNFSDYYPSAVNQNGRTWAIEPNSKRVYNPVLTRFGQEYQPGTDINGLNRFYEDNQDEYDRSYGDILRTFIEKRFMYVFQKFNIGIVPVLTQIVKDVAGNPLEANSDQLLNKITYPYAGQFGIGNVPSSLAFGKGKFFYVDNNKGTVNRIAQNGNKPISLEYDCNAFFIERLAAYNSTFNNGFGETGQPYLGDPTVYGVFDEYTNKYIIYLEEINRYDEDGELIFHQDGCTITFNEITETKREMEGFESKLSFQPDNMVMLNNLLITFKDGKLWRHNSDTYCNFYGVQYSAYIKGVFNDAALVKKTFKALTQEANVIWECPEIETNIMSYGTTPQQSVLIPEDFELLEGNFHAALLNDSNSIKGLINGDNLKGNYIIIKFQVTDASDFVYLSTVSLLYKNSFLTTH